MSAVVDSWSCPTTIYAGAGAIAHVPAAVGGAGPGSLAAGGTARSGDVAKPGVGVGDGRRVVLLADARVWPEAGIGTALARLLTPSVVVTRPPEADDEAFLGWVLAALTAQPGAAVVALGGGSILDVARLAALATADPAFGAVLTAPDSRAPLRMWPAARDAANPVVCIPTTLGTAAEVSPIAILRRGGTAAMFVSPALRARVAVLDPVATAGHDRAALVAGLLEPLSRVLVPAVTGSRLPLQDELATALVDVLFDLGDSAGRAPDDDWRLTAALASSQTHTAFLGLGRSPFGHALWPFATELMAALGCPKAQALAMLMTPWLRGLAAGNLGPAFGSTARVRVILGQPPDEAAERMDRWLTGLGPPLTGPNGPGAKTGAPLAGASGGAGAAEVAARVRTIWQATGFFLPGASPAEIEWLCRAAFGGLAAP